MVLPSRWETTAELRLDERCFLTDHVRPSYKPNPRLFRTRALEAPHSPSSSRVIDPTLVIVNKRGVNLDMTQEAVGPLELMCFDLVKTDKESVMRSVEQTLTRVLDSLTSGATAGPHDTRAA